MSAGGIIGMFFNLFAFAALWTIVGYAVDKLANIFNATIQVLPTLQDAATGFSLTQIVYGVIPVVAFIVIIMNYYLNEHSRSSTEV